MEKRIEYVDLMKGICITLVVMSHSGLIFEKYGIDACLRVFRIPLYFFLSGLFFKRYQNFGVFLVKKTNKLIVPFLFFAYIPYGFLAPFFIPDLNIKKYILMGLLPYNEPLWFLRSLFITYIFAYLLSYLKETLKIVIILISVIIFSLLSSYLHRINSDYVIIYYFYQIITSIIALPFFCAATYLKRNEILDRQYNSKYLIIIVILSLIIIYFMRTWVDYRTAYYSDSILKMYTGAFCGIFITWAFCYYTKHLPFFSKIGRYSLIVLGTHAPIIVCLQNLGLNSFFSFITTMLMMPVIINIFVKLFPSFTAQKDLITFSNGKLHLSNNVFI